MKAVLNHQKKKKELKSTFINKILQNQKMM